MDATSIDLASATERIGDPFRLDFDDGSSIELELTEATRASTAPSGGEAATSFAMLFRGPVEPALEQNTLPLHHDVWGLCHIFVVPVGQDEDGTYYEAVFNRD